MINDALVTRLLEGIGESPTPYHAAGNMAKLFRLAGFVELDEQHRWQLLPGGRYFTLRSGSSIVAFTVGKSDIAQNGIRLVGAHTDSPCLKVKPKPEIGRLGYAQLGIEVYGGALLNPWFDRDLSLAGRVSYVDNQKQLKHVLIDFERAIAVIPSLAIHLDREANKSRSVNAQTDMNPVLWQFSDEDPKLPFDFRQTLATQLLAQGYDSVAEVLDFNLSFYDTQAPARIGMDSSFITSARLDNLLSCFVGAFAMAGHNFDHTTALICHDHEEVGSRSDIGAQGTMMQDLLERLVPDSQSRQLAVRRSLMLSVDNAHGIHPNYPNRHDSQHGPRLNQGPVLKYDANQSYATSSDSAAFLKHMLSSQNIDLPLQSYVTRADTRCGSTIGPITASNLGIRAIDIGVPTFGMHSIRETAGAQDVGYLYKLIQAFYQCTNVAL